MRFWLSHTRIGHVYKNCSHCHRTSCLECWDVCINLLDVVLWVVEVGSGEQWWVCKYKVKLHTEQCNTSVLWHSELSWTELFPHTDTSARLSQEHLNYAECSSASPSVPRDPNIITGIMGQQWAFWTNQQSITVFTRQVVPCHSQSILILFSLVNIFKNLKQEHCGRGWLGNISS